MIVHLGLPLGVSHLEGGLNWRRIKEPRHFGGKVVDGVGDFHSHDVRFGTVTFAADEEPDGHPLGHVRRPGRAEHLPLAGVSEPAADCNQNA